MHFTKIVSGRRITLPQEVVDAMEARIGDNVRLMMAGGILTVSKAE